ncbi:hypothetical protein BH11ACT8_BH11ACT8_17300 [soil metagenome]
MTEGGTLRPTSPVTLAVWAIVGLVGGWLLHPLADRLGTPPVVTWTQPVLLFIVAAVLGGAAWSTWRVVHVRRERLLPDQAVNRLLLARACSMVGALVGGGYLGYGLSWIGDPAELADERLGRSLVAVLAAALVVVGALLLERACRVRKDSDRP